MENESLMTLMRARETLARISGSLTAINEDFHPEEAFTTGMLCSDLLALTEELLVEFAELFPDEYIELGAPPEFTAPPGPPEEIISKMVVHFKQCEKYFIDIGSLVSFSEEFSAQQQPELTDEDLWKFIAEDPEQ
jgi:hypothetical protein